jgi:hypothetical protein
MSQELPIPRQDTRSDEPATVEWGGAEPIGRGRLGRFLAGLRLDRRLAPAVAGLGAVAGCASLVGEWTVTSVAGSGPDGSAAAQVPAGVGEVGGFGTAYLVGLFGLVACLALVFFGSSPAVRHSARVAGLATAVALLAVLVAAASSLDRAAERRLLYAPDDGFRIEYGRGLVMAFVGTALFGLALYLTGRLILTGRPVAGPDGPDRAAGAAGDHGRPGGGWPWRRRGPAPEEDPDPDQGGPSDLSVTATIPFARPEDDGH